MNRSFFRFGIILFAAQILFCAGAAETASLSVFLLDNHILRLRVFHVTSDFATEFTVGQPTNQVAGVILDLRSADGDKTAVSLASDFFAAKKFPLVILVDAQTRGASATLAADLRSAGAGILIGSANLPGAIPPDIAVTVASADEKNFLANPYYIPAAPKSAFAAGTNDLSQFVDHTSEADLVRQRVKDGEEDDAPTPRVEPSQPVVRDPALARALDFFKALAVLHPARG